ncbi:unnamed protein product [Caenorhabditis angaria]|uniref:Uncharacterized protein n=1 Tax=Caenorhabditis angaria TaxID=860376 RepID=A0A9P1MYX2_9PELO|nr:unnamed protein product [Caenorhabditis angaria]
MYPSEFACGEIIKSFIFIEIIAILIQIVLYAITIYVTITSPFHYNLRFIGVFILSGYYTFLSGRLVNCFYESDIIKFSGDPNENIILIITSGLQYTFMACACSISFVVFVERFYAIKYVETYEFKTRKYLSIGICLEVTCSCISCGIILLFDIIPIIFMAIFGLLVGCASFIAYCILFTINRKRFELAMRNSDKYSLSVRFQLNESFKITTLIRNVIFFSGISNLIMGLILVFSESSTIQPHISLYLHSAFNICAIIYSIFTLLILLLSVKQYRRYFFQIRIVYAIVYPIFGRCYESEFRSSKIQRHSIADDTDTYFKILAAQWNY